MRCKGIERFSKSFSNERGPKPKRPEPSGRISSLRYFASWRLLRNSHRKFLLSISGVGDLTQSSQGRKEEVMLNSFASFASSLVKLTFSHHERVISRKARRVRKEEIMMLNSFASFASSLVKLTFLPQKNEFPQGICTSKTS